MSDLFKELKTDSEKVEEGVWFKNVWGDVELLIARSTSPKFKKRMQALGKPFRRQLRNGTLSDDKALEMYADAASKYILLDWRNVIEGEKPVKYTPEIGYRYIMQLEEFRDAIDELSKDLEAFREEYVEESEENLKNP